MTATISLNDHNRSEYASSLSSGAAGSCITGGDSKFQTMCCRGGYLYALRSIISLAFVRGVMGTASVAKLTVFGKPHERVNKCVAIQTAIIRSHMGLSGLEI